MGKRICFSLSPVAIPWKHFIEWPTQHLFHLFAADFGGESCFIQVGPATEREKMPK